MKRMHIALALTAFCALAVACQPLAQPAGAPAGPRAWIDAPLDGSRYALPLPAPIEIVSHATGPNHVAQVELNVNGSVLRSDPNPKIADELVTMRQPWAPAVAGNYTLLIRAQSTTGAWGDYARAVVTVGDNPAGGIIAGTVLADMNGNGQPNDSGDGPLDGVVVTLDGCAAKSMTTANGAFRFTGLPAGPCSVAVSKTGWRVTGTSPAALGYPLKAISDPARPVTISILMTPLASPTPTPTTKPGEPLPAAKITFYADQLRLGTGQCTTIHWQVTNASQVFLDNAAVALSDVKRDCPTRTVTHTLRVVTLDGQAAQRSLTLDVTPNTITVTRTPTRTATPVVIQRGCSGAPSIASFSAAPASIYLGQSATLAWGTVTNADSVEIDHDIGGVATPGSVSVSPGSTTTFTLIARCGANVTTRQATVTILTRGIIPPVAVSTPTLIKPVIR